jgi:RNA polymerase sigma-70 factor (ECF subfamily)
MGEQQIRSLMEEVALSGSQEAFGRLFAHYFNFLFSFSFSIVRSREAAEEIVEDVFVMLWNKRDSLTAIANLKVYLYVVTRNLSVNYLKQASVSRSHELREHAALFTTAPPTPENLLLASELLQAIQRAVEALPPRCRTVYKLVREEGLRAKEVADMLHISHRTVENHVAAAMHKIGAAVHMDLNGVADRG